MASLKSSRRPVVVDSNLDCAKDPHKKIRTFWVIGFVGLISPAPFLVILRNEIGAPALHSKEKGLAIAKTYRGNDA